MLEELGARCKKAKDGAEAVVLIKALMAASRGDTERLPDVILMDQKMPIMDGCAATQKIRGLGFEGAILGMTLNGDEIWSSEKIEDAQLFREAGASATLLKSSLTSTSLRTRVNEWLSKDLHLAHQAPVTRSASRLASAPTADVRKLQEKMLLASRERRRASIVAPSPPLSQSTSEALEMEGLEEKREKEAQSEALKKRRSASLKDLPDEDPEQKQESTTKAQPIEQKRELQDPPASSCKSPSVKMLRSALFREASHPSAPPLHSSSTTEKKPQQQMDETKPAPEKHNAPLNTNSPIIRSRSPGRSSCSSTPRAPAPLGSSISISTTGLGPNTPQIDTRRGLSCSKNFANEFARYFASYYRDFSRRDRIDKHTLDKLTDPQPPMQGGTDTPNGSASEGLQALLSPRQRMRSKSLSATTMRAVAASVIIALPRRPDAPAPPPDSAGSLKFGSVALAAGLVASESDTDAMRGGEQSEEITEYAETLSDVVRGMGFNVLRPIGVEDLLTTLLNMSKLPHCIFIPPDLGDASAEECITDIRAEFLPPELLPVFVVGAQGRINSEDSARLLSAGANDVIMIPRHPGEIQARVYGTMGIRKAAILAAADELKMHELISKIMPEKISEKLMTGQTMVHDSHESATIFFSDIVGFTKMTSQVPTASLVMFLNRLFCKMDQLTEVHKVYKVETIGDAYMAASGHEGAGDHTCRVLAFALDVRKSTQGMQMPNGDSLKMRIGLHCGPAFTGVVGLKCPRCCFFGDTVNVAARMEQNGLPGEINVSERVRQAVEAARFTQDVDQSFGSCSSVVKSCRFHPRGRIDMKGKGHLETFLVDPSDAALQTLAEEKGKKNEEETIDPLAQTITNVRLLPFTQIKSSQSQSQSQSRPSTPSPPKPPVVITSPASSSSSSSSCPTEAALKEAAAAFLTASQLFHSAVQKTGRCGGVGCGDSG
uniref:Guanylate cyclase n=1 Tax=Chromera velia CCMP2878 TaxID=1169474 RepID=A0A0G4G0L7_9ALVE|eukprot:Cvel_19565.t1-p1 / transcript=Cvel_19565.t1 / gene=Cvel_19565 / organism=Chromera_velia_CCMP2878 / gene_product=Guanylate cyclase 2G, putative / transcript_product=Guanylate cyclase 2G, putative / location=Cvel_scaffold1696:34764-40815(-) / protein_length=943 / sequence_SO=supercontig / SO=protein_coding / is_pseudo=false